MRNETQNVADLQAQVASCQRGANELAKMVAQFGLATVRAYMGHVQDNAEESVRRVLDVLQDGEFTYAHDAGPVVKVKISIDKEARRATVDFTGTSAQQPWNFNAPAAVTRAAVLYVFRTLVDDDIPMNEGCLKPIDIVLPEGSIVACRYPAAVCAGNVETSQWVTDTLYGALGVLAAAQGTMNNFTFGNATLPVLRDHLRRQRRRPGLRRHLGRAHPHDQLAPDRPRGAGMALPGAAGEPPHQPRLGRQGPAQGRRRHDPPGPLPRADAGGAGLQPPQGAAVRPARRRARGVAATSGSSEPTARSSSWRDAAGRRSGTATCSPYRRRAVAVSGSASKIAVQHADEGG